MALPRDRIHVRGAPAALDWAQGQAIPDGPPSHGGDRRVTPYPSHPPPSRDSHVLQLGCE
eukprot:scaffold1364_cov196-Prasinococcus_capsulatus_cf.AAC.1